jgi:hypothetical protein
MSEAESDEIKEIVEVVKKDRFLAVKKLFLDFLKLLKFVQILLILIYDLIQFSNYSSDNSWHKYQCLGYILINSPNLKQIFLQYFCYCLILLFSPISSQSASQLSNLEMSTSGLLFYMQKQRTLHSQLFRIAYPIIFLQITYFLLILSFSVTNVIPSLIYLPLTAVNLKLMQIVFSCWGEVEREEEEEREGVVGNILNWIVLAVIVAVF